MACERRLWTGFLSSAETFPERPAVFWDGKTILYRELRDTACRIAATIQAHQDFARPPLTAVFGSRTATAFAGVLAALLAGNGYVPLNCKFPMHRTKLMLSTSDCGSIIVDTRSLPQLDALLENFEKRLLVILPDVAELESLRARWPLHVFVGGKDLAPAGRWRTPDVSPDAIAYLLFTSGSSGAPKGVPIAHRNVVPFLDFMVDRYRVTEYDRLSQMSDMTFDLSVFDMFVSWKRGACLCCPSQRDLFKLDTFINDAGLTIWFSVPSTISFMKQSGVLGPGRFPSLRLSLFCGGPLPVPSAETWLQAAPNSILENLYGPTELTIACTLYRWDPVRSCRESHFEVVPIGYPYPGMNALVADENLNEVPPGSDGELLMNGPQMARGYWKDPEKTRTAFVIPPGRTEIFYRTGDRVRRPVGNAPLTYLGRTDSQIKVLGYRVELEEIEAVVRKRCGCDGVVAVGWPVDSNGCDGIEVFIEGEPKAEENELVLAVAAELPRYMVPSRFHFMARLPRNANNKFDRKAMLRLLEERSLLQPTTEVESKRRGVAAAAGTARQAPRA